MLDIKPRRILIILLGAIGDVTRALPLLWRLREGYPEARIAWAVEPAAEPLLRGHDALDEILVYRRESGARAFPSFLRAVRRGRFDLVLDLQRHLKSGFAALWSGARVRLGFHRRNSKEANWLFSTHTIPPVEDFSLKLGHYLRFAEVLGLAEGEVRFGLHLDRGEESRVDALLAETPRPFGAFFLGSRWESRWWFSDATAEVVRRAARELGLGVVLLGSAGEKGFAEEVAAGAGVPLTDLVGQTGLRDLVGIFHRARVAMGPDCGPMHIAAACGTPVVSLWGATSPKRSAPWGSQHLAVEGRAACAPCYVRRCPIGRLCMRRIAPQAVFAKVAQAVAGSAQGIDEQAEHIVSPRGLS
jgi:ADP-heptose:LPS heptosyltransferase